MPTASYPLDITGINPANLVTNEVHTLTEINSSTNRLLIPVFAPFYLDNFRLTHIDPNGIGRLLHENADYIFVLPYLAGSRSIAKMLYGAVSITNAVIDGSIVMEYQTLGGEWIADRNHALEVLTNNVYNPIVTTWDLVTNKQDLFPPINHDLSMDYVMGQQDLIDAIHQIRDAIIDGPQLTPSLLQALTGTQVNEGISRAEMYYYSKIK